MKDLTEINNDYDAVPYESFAYPATHPRNIYTIAKLFGMNPVLPAKCKILELGCASGGNIIPMAMDFPESKVVGIDYSDVQVKKGQEDIKNLGLKNIEIKSLSILDVDKDLGQFDYIVAHGILSWVPKNVQDKIFEICSNNLTENGLAYISYNTLPGWNTVKSIREMMLYHTKDFSDPAKKTHEARLLLNFIKEGVNNEDNPYSKVIEKEIDTLKDAGNSYLIHDHLEEVNDPCYFHEFMEKAAANDLQYVGDTDVSTMYLGNFPESVSNILMPVQNDVVKVEQYMDFIRNRRFRSTLLCKKGNKINRNISSDVLKKFSILSTLKRQGKREEIDYSGNSEVVFKNVHGLNFTTKNPIIIDFLLEIEESARFVPCSEILDKITKKYKDRADLEQCTAIAIDQILRVLFAGGIKIQSFAYEYKNSVSEKPKAFELSVYQARGQDWITNKIGGKTQIDLFNKILLQYLDGNNNLDEINAKILSHFKKGDLNYKVDGENLAGQELTDFVKKSVKNSLEALCKNSILVA